MQAKNAATSSTRIAGIPGRKASPKKSGRSGSAKIMSGMIVAIVPSIVTAKNQEMIEGRRASPWPREIRGYPTVPTAET